MAIAQRIELLQRGDTVVEHAFAALGVDVVGGVARQRSHHFHLMFGKKRGYPVITRLFDNGRVAAIHQVYTQGLGLGHELTKAWVHFRRPAGHVQRLDTLGGDEFQRRVHGRAIHELGTLGAGLDMAMGTGQVA